MMGLANLLRCEDRWVTAMGAWFAGKRVVMRGKDLHTDLADMDWMALYLFAITGRRFTPEQLRILNSIWTYTSYPEPRIWNNRIVALAGTARSTCALAVGAAVAVSEASIYGRRPDIRAIDFLYRLDLALTEGTLLPDFVERELQRYRGIPGYGRPVTRMDERLEPMLRLLREYGLDAGVHVRRVLEVERILLEGRWRLHMNIAALYAAVAADLGFSVRDYYLFMIPSFVAGMLPCYIDAAERPAGSFFPWRCDRVLYEGPAKRSW